MNVDDDPELRTLRDAAAPTGRFIALVAIALAVLFVVALWPRSSEAAPACMPTITGDPVGKIGIYQNRLGWHGHFYCRTTVNGATSVQATMWACLSSNPKCGPTQTLQVYLGVLADADPAAAAAKAWADNFSAGGCDTATGDLKLLCDIARFHRCEQWPTDVAPKPAECTGITLPTIPPPPAASWTVKAPGPRVVYTVVNGRRGPLTVPTRYVEVGSPCDPAVRVDELLGPITYTYMGVPGGGIAVCEQR